MRCRGRPGRPSHHLDSRAGTFHDPGSRRHHDERAQEERGRALRGGIRHLRAADGRRCGGRRRFAVPRGGPARARAVDAGRRAGLGSQGRAAPDASTRSHRFRRRCLGLGLRKSRHALDRIPGHAATGGAANRDRADLLRKFKRHRRRRSDLRLRQHQYPVQDDPLDIRRGHAVANRRPALPGRTAARLRDRVLHGRNCGRTTHGPGSIPTEVSAGPPDQRRASRGGGQGGLDRATVSPAGIGRTDSSRTRYRRRPARRQRTGGRRGSRGGLHDRQGHRQPGHDGLRLRPDHQPGWREKPDRREHHSGRKPGLAGRSAVRFQWREER